jgi:hypothetical protein
MQKLAQFLAATGRRLRLLGKFLRQFFRKAKLGLKVAVKIPFFVEIEASFETDWGGDSDPVKAVCAALSHRIKTDAYVGCCANDILSLAFDGPVRETERPRLLPGRNDEPSSGRNAQCAPNGA